MFWDLLENFTETLLMSTRSDCLLVYLLFILQAYEGVYSFVNSVCPLVCQSFCLSILPSICDSVYHTCYNQVLLLSCLIMYFSAATYQKLFIFGIGVPGRVLFHSTSMDPWVMPWDGARGQNL